MLSSVLLLTRLPVAEEVRDLKLAHQNCLLPAQVEARQQDLETARQAESQKHQAEITKLKLDLAEARKTNAELGTALETEKRLRAEEQKELRETSERADSVEKQLDRLKAKPAEWLSDLQWIHHELSSKFVPSLCLPSLVCIIV